ncbi:MAG: chromate efflux transporter [Pseudomonadota bacterium]
MNGDVAGGGDTPSWRALWRVFGRIGLLSFGGPAAQIALMQAELVERTRWLSQAHFLRALSLCMLLPGPEAMQLATYAGWRLRGVAGGLLGGALFVLPGAAVIAALAGIYLAYGTQPGVQAAFTGVKAAVIVIVVQALRNVARRALTGPLALGLAAFAFLALFVFALPYPLVIAVAAAIGALRPAEAAAPAAPPARANTGATLALWGTLWAAPLILVWLLDADFLLQVGLFFSRLAAVTFGGAYAVLAYMSQEIVQEYGWIETGQMIDALGLAETTPGPLILVTQFVAMLAGHAQGGASGAVAAGLIALWVTFVPCFLWIFLAGPFLDAIAARPRVAAALQGITAAVVGVILNLSLWFALHVLFDSGVPGLGTLDPVAAALTLLAGAWLLGLRRSLPETLALCAGAALAVWALGGSLG